MLVIEPAKKIPVVYDVDVAVSGGAWRANHRPRTTRHQCGFNGAQEIRRRHLHLFS